MPVVSATNKTKFDTVQAVALKSQGLSDKLIAETIGGNYHAVRQWLRRNFVSQRVAQSKISAVQKLPPKALETGDRVKAILSQEVLGQAEELSQCNLPIGTKDGTQGRAAVLKTVVESADKLFGWSINEPTTEIHFHALGGQIEDKPAIDVQEIPQAETIEPEPGS